MLCCYSWLMELFLALLLRGVCVCVCVYVCVCEKDDVCMCVCVYAVVWSGDVHCVQDRG